ncbi:MAG: bifunctional ADP-dependent NAD(P)H-hydrate dehydratase/NAD(P)H-hydrate epimerase [Actinomycetaceae bacterium]|nr:bifunctional ADP-dependent NAD(P)H-hydrate dehydratase/NAD(P)H-hydrate epimerase [Actinomycetaceae bacterium]
MERAYRSSDVRTAEEPLLAAGEPLMARAAYALSQRALKYLSSHGLRAPGSTVLLIVGRGNNGGDALYAGMHLARRGLAVRAVYYESCLEEGLEAAKAAGVRAFDLAGRDDADELLRELAAWAGIWIDGILGIGASGGARDPYANWINILNEERASSPMEPYVIAVDIPSGLGVDDGTVPGPVLRADATVAMGVAKPAHLLPPACHYVGDVDILDLDFYQYLPAPAALQLRDADVRDLWDVPGVDDHKYTRGVLGMLTGSARYPGAAVLGVGGALATGPGMVRYLGGVADAVMAQYPEVVLETGRVQAWVLGSGLDAADLDRASRIFNEALTEKIPVVLDAGAIELVHNMDVPSTVVLTPHEGEVTALLQARGEKISRDQVHANPTRAARLAATLTGATVLLKSAVDVVAAPDGPLYAGVRAPAWRATAGAGDVLAGILGALLASYGDELQELGQGYGIPARLAAAATHIHARAAAYASGVGSGVGYPISASKIVTALEPTIARILNPES